MRNSSRGEVDPFIVMDVMEAARAAEDAGHHIIHMEVGQPGTGAPREAVERLSAEMAQDPLGYTVGLGLPALRARIARHYRDWYGVELDGLIVASPANPTGTMLGEDEMRALAQACAAKGTAFISDEIYHGLGYDTRAVTALEVTDEVYVINSFSKYFSMTGWRVGWMVVPKDHVRRIERLAQNMFICPSHASQSLALHAMDCEADLDRNVEVYRRNRDLMIAALPAMGLGKFAPPNGAFYVYVDVSEYTDDSLNFCSQILEKSGVAVTPGLDFDTVDGHHWVRLSYARSTQDIREGLARLSTFMDEVTVVL